MQRSRPGGCPFHSRCFRLQDGELRDCHRGDRAGGSHQVGAGSLAAGPGDPPAVHAGRARRSGGRRPGSRPDCRCPLDADQRRGVLRAAWIAGGRRHVGRAAPHRLCGGVPDHLSAEPPVGAGTRTCAPVRASPRAVESPPRRRTGMCRCGRMGVGGRARPGLLVAGVPAANRRQRRCTREPGGVPGPGAPVGPVARAWGRAARTG